MTSPKAALALLKDFGLLDWMEASLGRVALVAERVISMEEQFGLYAQQQAKCEARGHHKPEAEDMA